MPLTPSAIRKLRVDHKRTEVNLPVLGRMKKSIKKAKLNPSNESLREAYSAIDKALKNKIIKKNRAARLKSRLVAELKTKSKTSLFAKTESKTKAKSTKKPTSKSK